MSTAPSDVDDAMADLPTANTGMLAHHISLLSRIYVGNVYFELTEADLRAAFEPYGYVRNIALGTDPTTHRHKGFCFVEYEPPEAAVLALEHMKTYEMAGRVIKVGRPSNFPAELLALVPKPDAKRIYVSNVHEMVSEGDLRDVFQCFGAVKAVALIPDLQNKKHKGYG